MPPEAVEQVKLNLFGLAQGGGRNSNGGVAADKLVQQLTGVYNALTNKRKALAEQDLGGQNAEIQRQIQAVDAQAADIYDAIQGVIGITGGYEDFSDTDEARNVANITKILQIGAQNGQTDEQQFQAVRKWVPQDRTDNYVRSLIRKARGG